MKHISTQLTVEYQDGELARFGCELYSSGKIEFPDSLLAASEQLGVYLHKTQSSTGSTVSNSWVGEENGVKAFVSANSNKKGFYVKADDASKVIEAYISPLTPKIKSTKF